MILSRKAIDSLKVALAVTLAYAIALHLDWEQPRWAAITIALVSMFTIGLSFNNAIERIFGTLTAGMMSLVLLGLFGQDRWLYLISLSAWMGLCTYLMGGKKFEGFWMMAGFATAVIAIEAGIDADASAETFEAVLLRLEQTLLGISIYAVIFILLWPNDGYALFKGVSRKLASTQQQLYRVYWELMHGQLHDAEKVKSAYTLRMQAIQQQTQFVKLLEGVQKERYEVWEVRAKWESYQNQVVELSETAAYWRESFSEIQELDLQELLPNLTQFDTEIDERLTQLGRMLGDDAPTQQPRPIELVQNPDAIKKLTSFQKAALTVFYNRLRSLEPLTRTMFNTLGDIKGFSKETPPVVEEQPRSLMILPDIERLMGSFRVVLTLWLCYLSLIYINDIPGGANLVAMGSASAMAVALLPQLPIRMFIPALTGFIIFTALIYIFLLPQLTTFLGLGLLIFSVSFGICYKYYLPQQGLFKGLGIVLFLTLLNIENEQHYDFVNFLDTSVMFYLIALVLQITAFIPFSSQPERVFLRLLSRFFRCSENLISTMPKDPHTLTRLELWKKAFYSRELSMLPDKLALWGKSINVKTLSGTSPEQIQALTINLQALAFRLHELLDARAAVQADRLVREHQVQELRDSVRAWQAKMRETFQLLSDDPTAGNSEKFQASLTKIVENMENRVKETLNESSDVQLSPQDNESFYRLLGAYRSVSEAMGNYVAHSDAVHWSRWKEEKFFI